MTALSLKIDEINFTNFVILKNHKIISKACGRKQLHLIKPRLGPFDVAALEGGARRHGPSKLSANPIGGCMPNTNNTTMSIRILRIYIMQRQ